MQTLWIAINPTYMMMMIPNHLLHKLWSTGWNVKRTIKPTNGALKPTNGALKVKPTNGALKPTNGALKPTNGALKPTKGALKPTNGALKPTHEDWSKRSQPNLYSSTTIMFIYFKI